MPIYEYRCTACGHELEALQRLADAPLKDCPACGQNQLRKLVSAAGFRLKGSGWYATDFKHSNKPAAKSNGSSDKGEPAASTVETASTKPAAGEAKAETKSTAGEAKAETKSATGEAKAA